MRIPRAWLFGVALGFILSCSLLVEQKIEAVRCTESGRIGPPVCDPGEICAAERCRLCVADETCADGIDNDCDGRVDEACEEDGGRGGGEGSSSGGGTSGGDAGERG